MGAPATDFAVFSEFGPRTRPGGLEGFMSPEVWPSASADREAKPAEANEHYRPGRGLGDGRRRLQSSRRRHIAKSAQRKAVADAVIDGRRVGRGRHCREERNGVEARTGPFALRRVVERINAQRNAIELILRQCRAVLERIDWPAGGRRACAAGRRKVRIAACGVLTEAESVKGRLN